MAFKKPGEIARAAVTAGRSKPLETPDKLLLFGFLAGSYIAFGGLLAVAIGGGINAELLGIGFKNLIFAGVFPVGLMLVVIGGSELFIGNCLLPPIAWLEDHADTKDVLKNWGWVYLGNFIGSVVIAYFLATATGLLAADPWHSYIIEIAEKKANSGGATYIGWMSLFWRAVGG